MLLSIIIPTYNEERTLAQIINKVSEVKLKKIHKEIIVVNDGSTDKTDEILIELKKKLPKIKIYHHGRNMGKGAAVRTGIGKSSGELILIQDADLEYDPEHFNMLLEPLFRNDVDVVYGNRFQNYPLKLWGSNKTILPTHWIANKTLTGLTNLLYGSAISDMETCYKIFKRKILKKVKLTSSRFEIEAELTAKILLNKYRIIEVPITVNPRTREEGKKIKWQDGVVAVWALLKYRIYS